MSGVGGIPKKSIEVDYVKDSNFKFNNKEAIQLIFAPHNVSLLESSTTNNPHEIGCKRLHKDCLCVKRPKKNLFDELGVPHGSHLIWIDPVGLPLSCISSILLEWKRYTNDSSFNTGLGIILRGLKESVGGTETFTLRRDSTEFDLTKDKQSNYLWMPSIEFRQDVLMTEGKRLNPYDVYPLVDFSDERFFVSNLGIMNNIQFLESFRTRTRNFIYLDISRPDFIFEKLKVTIESLLKSDFSVLDPVISPGGNLSSYFAEVCAAVLNGAKLFADQNYVPFRSDMTLNGYILLRNRK